jgi:hypothetical protein
MHGVNNVVKRLACFGLFWPFSQRYSTKKNTFKASCNTDVPFFVEYLPEDG